MYFMLIKLDVEIWKDIRGSHAFNNLHGKWGDDHL